MNPREPNRKDTDLNNGNEVNDNEEIEMAFSHEICDFQKPNNY